MKTEVLRYFKEYKALIENQTNNKLKHFHSDGGGEYINEPFKTFCAKAGIIMEQTAPYSPVQNSIGEWINQTLLEHARVMIFSKNISKTLWPEAIAYACYIKNRSPMHMLGSNTMLYEVFYNKKPNIARLQEFGIQCWIMVPEQRCTKLDPKAKQHIFTGITENAKAWQYYNTRSKIIQTPRNIIFNQQDTNVYPIPGEEEEEMEMNPPVILAATITDVDDVDQALTPNMEAAAPSMGTPEPGPWHSSRIADQGAQPDYLSTHNQTSHDRAIIMCEIVTEPENLKEMEGQLDWPIWKQAMTIEMDQHNKVGTWELVELPMGWTAIGCRWVYAVKTTLDGRQKPA